MQDDDAALDRLRLDVWLDVACLFKTRSEAQRACRGGRVEVNTQRATPHRTVQPGDRLSITRPHGRKQQIVIRALASRHIQKANARALYEDVTPPLTDAEREFYRVGRPQTTRGKRRPGRSEAVAPTTRERRALRRLKEN